MLVIANANQLRFNLHEIRRTSATLPLAVSFDHLRWQHRPTGIVTLARRATED
jgi:hypothetical protein